ncbi:hypothetical protein HHL22_16545 [Hymenobacter sp. RP-2-7]|uniref:Uncharacterized protein n=1 Tax=Hymenobacter polaris TaxID=2682546 RepID=A0A7Y0AGA8_9BACT|nr:hypothetical protein [Hymenobacter polaris]NML66816.1 hypothetical protein [Hymenobacter polaris]
MQRFKAGLAARAARYGRGLGLLLLGLLLKSCEVPDVQPFTKATIAMGTAIEESLRRVVADLNRVQLPAAETQNRIQLDTARQQLTRKAHKFAEVAHAFDAYAHALDAVAAAGQKRGAAINQVFAATQAIATKSAEFLSAALPVAAPINATAQPILKALGKVATDLNAAKTIHSLGKLASPAQDSAIQLSAQLLRLGMRHFYAIDSTAYQLSYANLPDGYRQAQYWYQFTLQRQDSLVSLLAALTQADNLVRAGKYASLENPIDHDGPLDHIRQWDYDPQRTVATAYAAWQRRRSPAQQRLAKAALLDALRRRELYYRPLTELPQAQLAAAQARCGGPARDAALLSKSTQLLDTWASSHHELRLLLAKASQVSRQDLVSYAQTVQTLAEELRAAKK